MEINLGAVWQNNCLICLQESDYKMISILESSGESHSRVLEKVIKCTNFKTAELKKRTVYPNNICRKCYSDLIVTYKFMTLSEHSKNKLENFNKKLQKYANDMLIKIADHSTGICKKCTDFENDHEIVDDMHAGDIIYEDPSGFENDILNEENKNENYKAKTEKNGLDNINIFEKSKKEAIERITKHKFKKCICDLCGNYCAPKHLKNHRMRHDKIKRFECEICKQRFATDTDLRRHMRVHTGEKPYACRYCDRKFSHYDSRIKHERTHTGERPYVCETCNKSFMYSYALKRHQSVHTGYKAFTCEMCSSGFTKKEYLQNHMKKHNEKDKDTHQI